MKVELSYLVPHEKHSEIPADRAAEYGKPQKQTFGNSIFPLDRPFFIQRVNKQRKQGNRA